MIDSFLPFDDADEPAPTPVPVPVVALAVVPPPLTVLPEVLPALREHVPGVIIRELPGPGRKKPWGLFVDTSVGGTPVRGAKFFKTEAEAEAAYPPVAAELLRRQQEYADKQRLTAALNVPALPQAPKGVVLFETLALRWLDERVKVMCTAATYDGYHATIHNHLLPIMRTWPMHHETLTGDRILHVLKVTLVNDVPEKVTLPSRLTCQAVLSAFFTWAKSKLPPGYLPDNPAKGIGAFVRNADEKHIRLHQPPNPMTRVQAEAFLSWMLEHNPRLYPLFLWLIDEGSRSGEVGALRWTNVDLAAGKAHIIAAFSQSQRKRDLQDDVARGTARGEKDTKTHRSDQYIDLSPRVVRVYTQLQATNREAWLKRGRRPIKEPEHCLLTRQLAPLRVSNKAVRRWFHKACKELKLVGQTGTPFTIHCLRDTFATLSLLEGQSLGWVSMMLGHGDTETTRKHYVKWIRLVEVNPLKEQKDRK